MRVSLTLLEAVLMLRVYALYEKDMKIAALLSLSLLAEFCFNFIYVIFTAHDFEVDGACLAKKTPRWVLPYGVFAVAQQLLIWGLTLQKRIRFSSFDNTSRKISQVVMRDGTWVLIGTSAILLTSIPYSLFIHRLTHIIFAILIPVCSATACRLILKMQQLRIELSATRATQQELTSVEL
ncbi:hypothetical protein AMATHDRAFT_41794 [Amanita thiersii Skay4041]|uniref:Uncharacterized protein n=1 Tax=Amanita thiersii Skay4041 TaxID=703135 RepID=A0A2A9NMV3_9AGAR|nr:hypothetical protein AMATHDRAFT_41794 [Amanita thiersii Skay4041]